MRTLLLATVLGISTMASLAAMAEEPSAATTTSAAAVTAGDARTSSDAEPDPHLAVSADATWAGSLVIVIALLFLSAAVVGPVVRANMPAEVPVAFSHDEDPSHHTGADSHEHHH